MTNPHLMLMSGRQAHQMGLIWLNISVCFMVQISYLGVSIVWYLKFSKDTWGQQIQHKKTILGAYAPLEGGGLRQYPHAHNVSMFKWWITSEGAGLWGFQDAGASSCPSLTEEGSLCGSVCPGSEGGQAIWWKTANALSPFVMFLLV